MSSHNEQRIRVQLPYHLQTLAQTGVEITLPHGGGATIRTLLHSLEARYPSLRGAIYEQDRDKRRPLIRFFACRQDYSFVPLDTPLPPAVCEGREPFMIVGAIAGG